MNELEMKNPGALQSPYDYRQVPLSVVATAVPLPESYKTDISMFPVWNQKKIGACVGHAFAKLAQYYWYKKTGEVVNFSPRFLYAVAKSLDNFPGEGTYPSLVAKILKDYGCATEALVQNDTDLPHEQYVYNRNLSSIPAAAFKEAEKYKIPGYAFLSTNNADEIKRAVYDAGMFAGLVRIGKEWWTDKDGNSTWDKNKILPLRPPAEIISGHEIAFYGWDKDTLYELSNSWSSLWADVGNGRIGVKEYLPFFVEGIVIKELPPAVIDEVKRLPKKPVYRFLRDLSYGTYKSVEVVALQDCLKYEGLMPAYIPSTGNYLEETRKAVLAFQKKYKLITLYQELAYRGKFCYSITRNQLNALYGQ